MSALMQILEDMLAESKAKGRAIRELKSGLQIEIHTTTSEVKIALSRDTVFPSTQEWDTVMRHFPYNTPKVMPAPKTEGSRHYITGTVPTQNIMQMKFG